MLPIMNGAVFHSRVSSVLHLYTRLRIAVDVTVGEGATALFKHKHTRPCTHPIMDGAVLHARGSSALHSYTSLGIAVDIAVGEGPTALAKHTYT